MYKKFISNMILSLLTISMFIYNSVFSVEAKVVKMEQYTGVEPVVNYESATIERPDTTGIIFIGDSRTVGMNNTVNIDSVENQWVVAKVGMGYNWLISDGWVQAQQIMYDNTQIGNWKIIFNLGVNDLGNIDKYKDFYLENNDRYDIAVVSVNPTVDEYNGVQCSDIEKFNEEITEIPDIEYIDTYDELVQTGYNAPDGLHYDSKTYNKIYSIIMNEV